MQRLGTGSQAPGESKHDDAQERKIIEKRDGVVKGSIPLGL